MNHIAGHCAFYNSMDVSKYDRTTCGSSIVTAELVLLSRQESLRSVHLNIMYLAIVKPDIYIATQKAC